MRYKAQKRLLDAEQHSSLLLLRNRNSDIFTFYFLKKN